MVLRYYCTREPELFRRHRISFQPGDIIRCTATTVLDLRRGFWLYSSPTVPLLCCRPSLLCIHDCSWAQRIVRMGISSFWIVLFAMNCSNGCNVAWSVYPFARKPSPSTASDEVVSSNIGVCPMPTCKVFAGNQGRGSRAPESRMNLASWASAAMMTNRLWFRFVCLQHWLAVREICSLCLSCWILHWHSCLSRMKIHQTDCMWDDTTGTLSLARKHGAREFETRSKCNLFCI